MSGPLYGAAPTPAPTPASPAASFNLGNLIQVALILAVGYLVYQNQAGKPAAYVPPVVSAAKDYHDGLGARLKDAEGKVRSGEVKTSDDLAKLFAGGAAKFAGELKGLAKANSDEKGNFTNPQAVADQLGQAALALGAK